MHTMINALKWLFCSGHQYRYQPVMAAVPTECPARSDCLGCDGKINCHLARILVSRD
ncbi:MAG: hypothetical protein GX071_13240 [Gammaproteobacteria bacterium]|nr:hypothetical protein [Gammaproteobacteria bacterium]